MDKLFVLKTDKNRLSKEEIEITSFSIKSKKEAILQGRISNVATFNFSYSTFSNHTLSIYWNDQRIGLFINKEKKPTGLNVCNIDKIKGELNLIHNYSSIPENVGTLDVLYLLPERIPANKFVDKLIEIAEELLEIELIRK